MDETRLRQAVRRTRALERLGTDKPRCVICGEDNPHCLEAHHIAGRKYDPATEILCRNCHRKASDLQQDHPKPPACPPSQDERIGHFLLGLADFLLLIVEKLREFGQQLIQNVGEKPQATKRGA